ncbi:putative 115 kDa protein in type-1 retrotransposable element [Termitomyces sp. T112]|nr:putative 115 kDa protein in type-1 retrotransposable element [Termitomyces sp. T112]
MRALEGAVTATVPVRKESTGMKRWWTKDLTAMRRRVRAMGRESYRVKDIGDHPAHEAFQRARNDYGQAIRDTSRRHWEGWLESVDAKSIWDANTFVAMAPSDGGKARTPTLREEVGGRNVEVEDNEGKARLFHEAFFYEDPVEGEEEGDREVHEAAFTWTEITDREVHAAIEKLKPHKAPGLSGIPNVVLKKTRSTIVPYLGPIFRATFEHKVYPTRWKVFKTAVLQKPNRDDYSNPNSYRPIALLDTVAKVLSSCVKTKLAFFAEKTNILPRYQFGGRPGRSTTDSLHVLTSFVKDAWRRGREVVVVFMDVKGAFPNTVPRVLLRDMRRKGVPEEVVGWFARKLEGRETIITFDDYKSRRILVNSGLDQGCNTSGICYNFYNAGQIEGARGEDGELAGSFADDAYVDDAYVAADGGDMEEAARKVEEMMRREGEVCGDGVLQAQGQGTRRREAKPATRPTVTIGGTAIRMETSHKFLGVILDQELRFKEHAAYAQGKGTAAAMQTKRLVKVNGGVSGSLARRLYEAVVVPNMLYAADVWCASGVRMEDGTRQKARGFLEKMQRVQRMGALQITGALRTTPTDLLEAHAGIEPMDLRIQRMCVTAAARIAAMPDTHPLRKPAEKVARFVKRHRAPLHYLMKALGEHPKNMETIEIVRLPPDWECPVTVVLGESKDEAEERERNNRADVRIYMDGSGHHGNIGAAAVLYREGQKAKVMRKRIGGEEKHTVFEGECVGQAMGFELLRREVRGRNRGRRRIQTVTVGTDNQAGMKALEAPGRGTARYIVDEILKGIQKVREIDPSMRIRVYWTPGHAGIPGNERADREAKKAAEGKDTETKGLALLRKPLKASRAAVLATHKKRWREAAREHIRKAPRFDRLRAVDPNAPDMRNILQTLASVPRRHASILTQLRTGHCPLNQYLHRFKKADSPICGACNQAEETVEHFLVHCEAYRTQRNTLFREADLRTAPMSRLLSDASVVKALFQFINSTGRFRRTYGDLAVPERAVTDKPKGRKRRGRK